MVDYVTAVPANTYFNVDVFLKHYERVAALTMIRDSMMVFTEALAVHTGEGRLGEVRYRTIH